MRKEILEVKGKPRNIQNWKGRMNLLNLAWTRDWNHLACVVDQVLSLQKELNEVRWMSKKDKAALNTVYATVEHAKAVSKEKSIRIAQ